MSNSRMQELKAEIDRRQSIKDEMQRRGLPIQQQGEQQPKQKFTNQSIEENPGALVPGMLGIPQPDKPRTLGGELTSASLAIPGVNAARLIPNAGRIAKGLANAGGMIAQNAAIGGTANALDNEDVASGAERGGAIGAGLAALPYVGKGLGKLYGIGKSIAGDVKNTFNAAKGFDEQAPDAANSLLEKLGGGASTKEEASKKLASHIMEGYSQRAQEAGQFFEHPLSQVGENERIYRHVDPLISTKLDKEKDILSKIKNLNVGKLFDKFKSKPNFENAHKLQSELGAAIGDLKSNLNKTPDDRETIKNLNSVRNQLKEDIMDFLKTRDSNSNENLAPMYKKGIDLYRENVEPYLSSKKLREITRGGKETPKNIEKIFDTPSNVKNLRTGESKLSPQHKILEDLPEEAKNLILFNKVGASKHAGNADKLSKALIKAENEGYQSYFSPELKSSILDIANKSKSDSVSRKATEEALRKLERAKYIGAGALAGSATGGAGLTYLLHKLSGTGGN